MMQFFFIFFKVLIIIIPLLLSVAYFTLAERKILGAIQRRRGPNVIGVFGLLQPLSDGFKLFVKENILPSSANRFIFTIAPIISFSVSLLGWAIMPYDKYAFLMQCNIGLLYILCVSSLGVYGIILAGWSSNSKYAFLGSLRSTAQMISYEVSIGFAVVTIALTSRSFNLYEIVEIQLNCWNIITFYPLFLIFISSALAETNRHPFDLPEAEAELVSGYNVEYSGMSFALFSLAEYSNMLFMSSLISILFLGGWFSPFFMIFPNTFLYFIIEQYPYFALPGFFWFSIKVCFLVYYFIIARAALPRYKYNQLMDLGWKIYLPISIAYFIISAIFISY